VPVLRDARPGPLSDAVGAEGAAHANLEQQLAGAASLGDRVAVERTLILAKPDAVERSLAGEIVARFERRGLRLRAPGSSRRLPRAGRSALRRARREAVLRRAGRLHHPGPTLAFVLEGEGAIATARKTIGATNPADDDPGSLRGEFAVGMPNNLVHGSDSTESAEREIGLWFPDGLV
jgi:nucleoside-diphosphate kinase